MFITEGNGSKPNFLNSRFLWKEKIITIIWGFRFQTLFSEEKLSTCPAILEMKILIRVLIDCTMQKYKIGKNFIVTSLEVNTMQ